MKPRRKIENPSRRVEMKMIKNFLWDESGATAVEYGIMVAAIAAIIIVTVNSIGDKVLAAFEKVDDELRP